MVQRIKNIVELIREEEALRTANVTVELGNMDGIARRLNEALGDMGRERGAKRQYLYQLMHGKRDQGVLAGLMEEMNRSNVALTLFVSVAHVGVSLATGQGLVADRKVIRRIDRTLQDVLGRGKGLRIAGLLDSRSPESRLMDSLRPRSIRLTVFSDFVYHCVDVDTVPITEADLMEIDREVMSPLEEEEEKKMSEEKGISVMVNRNYARDQSLMINGAVGRHDWMIGSKIKVSVTGNETSGQATMLAGVISEEALSMMFEARKAR